MVFFSFQQLAALDTRFVYGTVTMGIGAVLEPLVVVTLLFGGAWINRDTNRNLNPSREDLSSSSTCDKIDIETTSSSSRSSSPASTYGYNRKYRQRRLQLYGWMRILDTPDTTVFQNRLLSRVLFKFPFLVEAWYWALIYWVRIVLWTAVSQY